MKIVILGGTGLIGKKLTALLQAKGHQPLPASPSTGVDAFTGKGLAEALAGAHALVDVSNAPSWAPDDVLRFFQTSTQTLLAAEAAAGVQHHLALSVVGTDRLTSAPYFRAKDAQERLIQSGPIPYTLLRATQFFEFIPAIADSATQDGITRLPSATLQPIAADDVAAALADLVLAPPTNRILEVAGPAPIPLDALARQLFAAKNDPRQVTTDNTATYFGTPITNTTLTPAYPHPILATTTYADWLRRRT